MTPFQRLEALLQIERHEICAGRLDRLAQFSTEKSLILAELSEEAESDPDEIARISELAKRNADLIDAAARGVRSAMALIKRARSRADTKTYDPEGKMHSMLIDKSSIERRF